MMGTVEVLGWIAIGALLGVSLLLAYIMIVDRAVHGGPYDWAAEGDFPVTEPPLRVDDHPFDGGWHQRDTCQFIYPGESDFTQDTECGLAREQHSQPEIPPWVNPYADDDMHDVIVDEDDKCEGHPSYDGTRWLDCPLPTGHGKVPEHKEAGDE